LGCGVEPQNSLSGLDRAIFGYDVPYGELTSFQRVVQAKDDEIVAFP